MRWEEEKKQLPEEMRRVLVTLEYEENRWTQRCSARAVDDPYLREGLIAYALDQARIRREMRATFREVCIADALQVGRALGDEWRHVNGLDVSDLPDDEAEEYRDIAQMYVLDGEDLELSRLA